MDCLLQNREHQQPFAGVRGSRLSSRDKKLIRDDYRFTPDPLLFSLRR
jgi:hypothetical protein